MIVGADTELSIFWLRCQIADDQRRRRKSQMTKGFDAEMAGQAVSQRPGQIGTGVNKFKGLTAASRCRPATVDHDRQLHGELKKKASFMEQL